MNDNDRTIYCTRCGAEMSANARYCMKCGNLNYDHDENQNMRQFLSKEQSRTYEVGSGQILEGSHSDEVRTSVANASGNKKVCFYLNYFLYVGVTILVFVLIGLQTNFDFEQIMASYFPTFLLIYSFYFFYFYATQLVYMKCNKPWWASFIPVYNMMVLADAAFHKSWVGLLTLIPVVGPIVVLVLFYKLGECFRYNGILTALFPFIYIPVIAFGSHFFEGRIFVDEKSTVEKEYRLQKVFLTTSVILFLAGLAGFLLGNMDEVNQKKQKLDNEYYVNAARQIVNTVESNVMTGMVICEHQFNKDYGNYYFYYADISDIVYLPLYSTRDVIEGYVRVENRPDGRHYYVSLSDGKRGFSETLSTEIDADDVTDYTAVRVPTGANHCDFSH